jgi:hypothetical protein
MYFLRVLRALRRKRSFFICKLQFHHEGHEEHEDETSKIYHCFCKMVRYVNDIDFGFIHKKKADYRPQGKGREGVEICINYRENYL